MKQFLVYIGLFIGFVATLGGIRYLDNYSKTYQQCAQQWQTKIEMAEDRPYLSEHLLEYLDNNELIQGGKTCPKLLGRHALQVRKALEKNL